jgi:6-phosphogluconolactonase (cycloisomerase 2 family)
MLTIDPSGKFLFGHGVSPGLPAGSAQTLLVSLTIDPTTGSLTQAGTVTSYNQPGQIVCDPTGRFAYTADLASSYGQVTMGGYGPPADPWWGGVVSEYVIDPVAGLLRNPTFPLGTFNEAHAGENPWGVACHPSGKYVYCINSGFGDVISYSIDPTTGQLTMIGEPISTADGSTTSIYSTGAFGYPSLFPQVAGLTRPPTPGTSPFSVQCDPSGKYVYIANFATNDVATFSVGSTGALVFVGTATAGTFTGSVATAP